MTRCILRSWSPAASYRLLVLMTLAGWSSAAFGQLPTAQMTTISPAGAQFGTSVEVKVAGSNLDEADRLFFSHPGITAEAKMTVGNDITPAKPVGGRFKVQVAGSVPPGTYEARVVGRFGVSNPRAFVVGLYQEDTDGGANKQREKAKQVPLDSTINGYVDANTRDFFKVSLQSGQRVLIECAAQRVDSRMNGTLKLYDAAGKELMRSKDYFGDDPFLDFSAPQQGDYYVTLSDATYRGGAEYFYRLTTHLGPHLDFVFPPSGLAGSSGQYTLYGRNLPDGIPSKLSINGEQLEELQVSIPLPTGEESQKLSLEGHVSPQGVPLDSYEYRLNTSNPVTVYFADAATIAEAEPNNDAQTVQTVTAPCEVVGRFFPARDIDWIQFTAQKGQVFHIEVFSHRLGLATDPRIIVQRVTRNDKDEESVKQLSIADDPRDRNSRINSDFDTSTDDPNYRLKADQDATYRIGVWDQFGAARNDPRNVYRLAVREATPDFRLVAVPQTVNTPVNANLVGMGSACLRKGGTTTFTVRAERRDGFNGRIEVQVENLPAGVTTRGASIAGDQTTTNVIFEAAEDAADWSGIVRVVGKAQQGDQELIRYARGGAVVWGTGNRTQQPPAFRVTRDIALAVMPEPAPTLVTTSENKTWETSRGGQVEIPIKVTRRRDFKGDLKLVSTGLPKDLKPGDLTVKGDAAEGKLTVSATKRNAKAGLYTFYLRADAKGKFARNPDAISASEQEQKRLEALVKQLEEAASEAAAEKADKSSQAAAAKLKQAQAAKDAADKQLAAVKKANAPKDFNFVTISPPIRLHIVDTPLKLSVAAPEVSVQQGGLAEIQLGLERLFGFADKVDMSIVVPKSVKGLKAAKLSLDKDTAEGKLKLTVQEDATVGDHTIKVRAKAKFNKIDVQAEQSVVLKVAAKS